MNQDKGTFYTIVAAFNQSGCEKGTPEDRDKRKREERE